MIATILYAVLSSPFFFFTPSQSSSSSHPPEILRRVLHEKNYVHFVMQDNQLKSRMVQSSYWLKISNQHLMIADPNSLVTEKQVKISDFHVGNAEKRDNQQLLAVLEKQQIPLQTYKLPQPTMTPTPAITAPPVTEVPYATITPVSQPAPSSYDAVYQAAGAKYGVPWQILYGLHMTESGGRNGPVSNGYGPEGPMQFMPGTWRAYAVSANGGGVPDINNAMDAIYTAANFLAKHGSLANGLAAYGGNTAQVLVLAKERGYQP